MYERSYGDNYDGDRPVKEDAALIRATIKTLVKAGELPADWKFSVRYRTGSMMRAIDVTATSPRSTMLMEPAIIWAGSEPRVIEVPAPDHFADTDWMNLSMRPGERHEIRWCDTATAETKAVKAVLDPLVASYNHDGSESMIDYFDVKFYGAVNVHTADGVNRFERPAPASVYA